MKSALYLGRALSRPATSGDLVVALICGALIGAVFARAFN